jgi:hypothetical protein
VNPEPRASRHQIVIEGEEMPTEPIRGNVVPFIHSQLPVLNRVVLKVEPPSQALELVEQSVMRDTV